MKTWNARNEDAERKWYVVDAENQTLGRLATQIATVLRGKHKATFTPHTDQGDFVVVINADKVKMSGKKWQEKLYSRHTGYFGGLKQLRAEEVLSKDPSHILRSAVAGMLPKNRLADKLIQKLKAYPGAEHPHKAQNPQPLTIK